MSRQHQFKAREENILAMAEQLLLESGDGDITLDSLADQLDLAKGTLYKHFSSKDELYLRIIIRYEEQLFEINRIDDCPSAGVARMILQQLFNPHKAMLLNQIEERLAASVTQRPKVDVRKIDGKPNCSRRGPPMVGRTPSQRSISGSRGFRKSMQRRVFWGWLGSRRRMAPGSLRTPVRYSK